MEASVDLTEALADLQKRLVLIRLQREELQKELATFARVYDETRAVHAAFIASYEEFCTLSASAGAFRKKSNPNKKLE